MTTRPESPGVLASAARILDLSFGQMLWSRRSAFLAVLVVGPVALGIAIRLAATSGVGSPIRINGADVSGGAVFGLMMWLLYVRFIVPVLGVFYGTSLIADEVDDRTITYLFTRPIPRRAVVIGKYLAFLASTVLLILPSVVLVFFLVVPVGDTIAANFPSLVSDLAMLAVGLAVYGAVFAFVGARMKRPLVVGLAFAFGWEPGVLLFPGYLKRLTVAYYLQALVKHEMPQDSAVAIIIQVFREVPSLATSLAALALIGALALWAASRAVDTREYVLEQ
jgi:ABC-2 type transport system permease protein